MKISILGLNDDAAFFLKRSSILNKNKQLDFFAFDDRKIQNKFKKDFPNLSAPWNLNDVLESSEILLNFSALKSLPSSISIIEENKLNCPIIDFSPIKKYSIKIFNQSSLSNKNIIHAMSPGRVEFSNNQEIIKLPIVLNNNIQTDFNEKTNLFFKRLKISLKFMDEIEHDEILRSNYYLPNILFFLLAKKMNEKSKIISNTLGTELLNNMRDLVNVNINDDLLKDYVYDDLNGLMNLFNQEMKEIFVENNKLDNSYLLNSKQAANLLDPNISVPKSKDTIMSLFFGTRFTRLVSGWSKIDKSND